MSQFVDVGRHVVGSEGVSMSDSVEYSHSPELRQRSSVFDFGHHESASLSVEQKICQSVYQLLLTIIRFFTPECVISEKGWALVAWARGGNAPNVERLLKEYHCVRRASKYDALVAAVMGGHVHIVKILVEHGVYTDSLTGELDRTPLMHAIAQGKDENKILGVVNAFIEHGVCIDAVDKKGETALMLAVRKQYLQIIDRLIQAGANVNAYDDCWQTPLMKAVERDHQGIMEILLHHGADRDDVAIYSQMALIKAGKRDD